MVSIRRVLAGSIATARRMRILLLFAAAVYAGSFLAGYMLVHFRVPFAVALVDAIIGGVLESPVFTPITGALEGGNLGFAIAYTFLLNLSMGAFATTTLPGIIPVLGGIGSVAISGFRGFVVGLTYYYVLGESVGLTILGLGTAVLELGAYVFSTAAGINLSLAAVFPRRYNVERRLVAFKEAWKDAARLYVLVVILLALGAVWEMTGIFLVAP
jgi:uncharacterized membrane protein SpoIIM required for sporulation